MNINQPTTNIEQPTSNTDSAASRQTLLDKEITLFDLLLVLAKRWKMIVGVPLIAAVITAIITLFMPNIYTAKTMILLGDDDSGGMMGAMLAQMGGLAGIAAGGLGGPTKTELYVTMLKSETIKDPIIDRFKLMEVYEAEFRMGAYQALGKRVLVNTGKKDGVITIAVDDKDPKRAAEMANVYVEELEKLVTKLAMTSAGKSRPFLEDQLAGAKANLAQAEDRMKAFQTSNKAVSLTDQAKASIESVALLRGQLAAQEVQLGTLQRQLTDSSQEIKTAKATVANIKKQIAQLEGNSRNSSIPSVGSVAQLGQEYIRLLRELKIQETLVELLTKQYEMVKINEVKNVSPFQVLQKAKVPEKKSKPHRALLVIIVTLASLLFSVLAAFAQEKISNMSDVEATKLSQLRKYFVFNVKWTRS